MAYELDGEIEDLVDEDIELNLSELALEEFDITSEGSFHIEASGETTQSVKVQRAKRNPPGVAHPAEYKNFDATIRAVLQFIPEDEGFIEGEVTQEGGKPSPPSPKR